MIRVPTKLPHFTSFDEVVDRAAAAENLRAAAASTNDSDLLLGLSFFAKTVDPVRRKIGEMATRGRRDYAPIIAVLVVTMDSIDEQSVGELLEKDPENALGYYFQGTLSHVSNLKAEAVEAFRKAASCRDLRLYDSVLGEALFKAMDALSLQGGHRLSALTWTIARRSNFGAFGIQPIYWAFSELARGADTATRAELGDM